MSRVTIQQAYDLAVQHRLDGRLREAEEIYRQILASQPEHAAATHDLGLIAHQAGQIDAAIELIRGSIALSPMAAGAYSNLGNALKDKGQLDEAIGAWRHAIALNPTLPEAHSNLGNALRSNGDIDEAIIAYRRAIALRPNRAEVFGDLGDALHDNGQLDEAIAAYRQAISLRPAFVEVHNNLGIALAAKGETDEAIAAYRQAIALNPHLAGAHSNLGNALRDKREFDAAIAAIRRAIEIDPNFHEAYSNLGAALADQGEYDEAICAYRRAIALKPSHAQVHENLAGALKDIGQLEEAIAEYRRAIQLNPDSPDTYDRLLYALHLRPGLDTEAIAEEHRRWNRQYAAPLGKFVQLHTNDHDPDRPLRIGYVSPDFCHHSVSFFLPPLLRGHNRKQFHVTCYTTGVHRDSVTDQIQACADQWISLVGKTDERAAGRIRDDRIDILVDLAGHTPNNRLLVFARKPAPVQATYLGYPDTTGMSAIDWRMTDSIADPPGAEAFCSERLFRLARTAWCFCPLSGSPPVQARQSRKVVFGCFNVLAKINGPLLALWARILQEVPDSRLLVKNGVTATASVRQWMRHEFEVHGIAWDRIELMLRHADPSEHLRSYGGVDVALDCYPYHGTTTTCEALWMGVPVITLVGKSHVSRVGASLLSNVGLQDLIAEDADGYVQRAVDMANNAERRQELKLTLRPRMQTSPLMDGAAFARDVEAAYRQMWRIYVGSAPA